MIAPPGTDQDSDMAATTLSMWRRPTVPWAVILLAIVHLNFAAALAQPKPAAAPRSESTTDAHWSAEQADKFLAQHCRECHSGEKPKGEFSLEELSPGFAVDTSRNRWHSVFDRLQSGEMPPKSKPRPDVDQLRKFNDWINREISAAVTADRTAQGRVVLRRLNRVEYENTIRDLLGIQVELKDLLPLDTSADGFDNAAASLHTSSFLMERYLDAADKALDLAIANTPQPPLFKKRFRCGDEWQVKSSTESVYRNQDDALICFSSSPWNAITLGQFYPPDRGRYRFRISASGFQSAGKPVTYRLDAGPMLMGTKNHLVGYFDSPADEPTVTEFVDHIEARSTIRLLPFDLATAHVVNPIGADKYEGPGLAIQWIEVEGPLHEEWPPKSHRQLLGDLRQQSFPHQQIAGYVEVVSENAHEDAKRVLTSFARRAFRRPVLDDDVMPLLEIVQERLDAGETFELSLRAGLKGVLVSPRFLFLDEVPGRLDDYSLASRLSYFLWSTMPDEELLALAKRGNLGDPNTLQHQVERLLDSPKAAAFTENFLGQWLGLRLIDFTEPDRLLYPEFDDMLKAAMLREAQEFFDEVLRRDLPVTNFVDSDFTFLNERLARHYGIPDVQGHALHKVALSADSHRGGVMTMAAVLKVTANGTSTSPVVRGAWVMDRILGTPPKPPPPNVAAVDPDIRGTTTIREQLAKHRQIESCAACHSQIDPPGFALENFDVIGGWRENYRSVGNGEPVTIDGQRMHYLNGPPVDPADQLHDGRRFQNIDDLKRLLLQDEDQLTRALATRLVTYATGRVPDATDEPKLESLVRKLKDRQGGVRTLIHEIVASDLFRNK
jgi:hypothetical protein